MYIHNYLGGYVAVNTAPSIVAMPPVPGDRLDCDKAKMLLLQPKIGTTLLRTDTDSFLSSNSSNLQFANGIRIDRELNLACNDSAQSFHHGMSIHHGS